MREERNVPQFALLTHLFFLSYFKRPNKEIIPSQGHPIQIQLDWEEDTKKENINEQDLTKVSRLDCNFMDGQ